VMPEERINFLIKPCGGIEELARAEDGDLDIISWGHDPDLYDRLVFAGYALHGGSVEDFSTYVDLSIDPKARTVIVYTAGIPGAPPLEYQMPHDLAEVFLVWYRGVLRSA
jgi:hypothetical protein